MLTLGDEFLVRVCGQLLLVNRWIVLDLLPLRRTRYSLSVMDSTLLGQVRHWSELV